MQSLLTLPVMADFATDAAANKKTPVAPAVPNDGHAVAVVVVTAATHYANSHPPMPAVMWQPMPRQTI